MVFALSGNRPPAKWGGGTAGGSGTPTRYGNTLPFPTVGTPVSRRSMNASLTLFAVKYRALEFGCHRHLVTVRLRFG